MAGAAHDGSAGLSGLRGGRHGPRPRRSGRRGGSRGAPRQRGRRLPGGLPREQASGVATGADYLVTSGSPRVLGGGLDLGPAGGPLVVPHRERLVRVGGGGGE